jgi:D-alanyl-D-alanine carboxypeptidase
MDEIPVALRERTKKVQVDQADKVNLSLIWFILPLGLVGLLLLSFSRSNLTPNPNTLSAEQKSKNLNTAETDNPSLTSTPKEDQNQVKTNSTPLLETPQVQESNTIPENVLGHLPYEEAPPAELKPITSDGSIKLRANAAAKFKEMQASARASGVILVPISGFRSVSQQEYLFFQIKEQRAQVTTKRAEVSAPPGYSEHHTGYAIDIGDGNAPATNLSQSFEKTSAYQWLAKNAPKYSFELSFTPDNLQGVSYEPWHWRYVGDTHSLETFYKARNLQSTLK